MYTTYTHLTQLIAKINSFQAKDSEHEFLVGFVHDIQKGYSRRGDRPALARADMHIIGEIVGASGFKSRQPALSCRWRLVYDSYKTWAVVRGLQVGGV
eukprot:1159846-Pelagomonas_calceolata.AAC.21